MGEWWHKDIASRKGTTQKDVIIEPRAGRPLVRTGRRRQRASMGPVIAYDPPRRLLLAWQLNREFDFDPDC